MDLLSVMMWPLIACLTLPWLLVYMGLHVVQRQIIFVDLALAQVAALGTCVGLLAGCDVHSWQSYLWSAGFTVAGAVVFTLTRTRHHRVPQEALIGVVYVVAAAAGILTLSGSAGGKEELQRSLVGELLVVPPAEVLQTIALYLVVGAVHYIFRGKFLAISSDPETAQRGGIRVRWWDFVFYVLFGFVVTSFVHLGGVLMTFSYLIVPALCANYLVESWKARLATGWAVATLGSLIGLYVTPKLDLPIGATIVCVLGAMLALTALVARFRGPTVENSASVALAAHSTPGDKSPARTR
ncbi:MAG TPA: metal ABC transporter permease [Candidatus Paceibacterota bacterium]|nr:metal ABC transporter permease [Verrucomicrobiota bacterium]HRY47987.1 metal ABC transporter permease [Candidatus Paceibacterota bacterium]HSA00572.1 metal ABC transporter permease [Candidatus Paceibacterota bacterium]